MKSESDTKPLAIHRRIVLDVCSTRGLTKAGLADALGVSYRTVCRWCEGTATPRAAHIEAMRDMVHGTVDTDVYAVVARVIRECGVISLADLQARLPLDVDLESVIFTLAMDGAVDFAARV